ncbi:hypothetical protein O0I10_012481 [Lichtheimia ornata]|uniref:3beta-hydroxysteroid 3-dehydrogenase n=1 Tax=Lichtheimia ornata TaxID=688661 RepID=A0AAD7XPK0_9FUNG|nr:uncharacterized protein O0I10_012481 [Lichtheimia ornata]KAJ8651934.1 hypothetical protein O0I10_012481 [Lichtheimia ornata]
MTEQQQDRETKVAIVTGANAGVGYGIIQRLLEQEEDIQIVMACRNGGRASRARLSLLQQFPSANINIELVDLANAQSVFRFCDNIKSRYTSINYLFCNAGILSTLGLNWKELVWLFFQDPAGFFERSDATIQATGEINEDGMGKVFAANVFGHYVMLRELEGLLDASGDARVIWTSSLTAEKSAFDIDDWQGLKSTFPYESSKWACDLISIKSNDRYSSENHHIISFTTSPGVVASAIIDLPMVLAKLRVGLQYVYRFLGVSSQTITGYAGAISNVYVALQPLKALNYLYRYTSLADRWGTPYVEATTVSDYDPMTAEKLLQHCELAYQAQKRLVSSSKK